MKIYGDIKMFADFNGNNLPSSSGSDWPQLFQNFEAFPVHRGDNDKPEPSETWRHEFYQLNLETMLF